VDVQSIPKINHLKTKLMFYNILIIICLLKTINFFSKLTHEIIYYLFPLVYTCEYVYIYHAYVYRKSILLLLCCSGFWGSTGLVMGMDYHLNRYSEPTESTSISDPFFLKRSQQIKLRVYVLIKDE